MSTIIQAIAYVAVVYVSGQPGDIIICDEMSVRGIEQTQTLLLKEKQTSGEVHFPVRDDLVGDASVEFVCRKMQR
jgi:hypothetical protein